MLKKIRELFGYTQQALAAKVHTTQNYYTLVERAPNRSAPTVQKIGNFLGISVDFLMGNEKSYPFTRDFYVFTLREESLSAYSDIFNFLLKRSAYLDVIYFERSTEQSGRKLLPVCIAIKDDHGTIILINRRAKRRTFTIKGKPPKTVETESLVGLNLFRQMLYEKTWIYEKTLAIEDSLYKKIKKAVDRIITAEETPADTERVTEETNQDIEPVSRKDIEEFFPTLGFFERLYEVHRK